MVRTAVASVDDDAGLSNEWRAEDPSAFAAWSGYSVDCAESISIKGGFSLKPGSRGSAWESGTVVGGRNPNFYAGAENSNGYRAEVRVGHLDRGSSIEMKYSNSAKVSKDMATASHALTSAKGGFVVYEEAGYKQPHLEGEFGTMINALDRMTVVDGAAESVKGSAKSDKAGIQTTLFAKVETAEGFEAFENAFFNQGEGEGSSTMNAQTYKSAAGAKGIVYSGSAKSAVKDCMAVDSFVAVGASSARKSSSAQWNLHEAQSDGIAAATLPEYMDVWPVAEGEFPVAAEFKDTATSRKGGVVLAESFKASGAFLMRTMEAMYVVDDEPGAICVDSIVMVGGECGTSSLVGSSTIAYNSDSAILGGNFKGSAAPYLAYSRLTAARYCLGKPEASVDEAYASWLESYVSTGKGGSFSFKEYAKATSDGVVLDAC
jgi:hypothetical protein